MSDFHIGTFENLYGKMYRFFISLSLKNIWRCFIFTYQKLTRGFSDRVTWNLDKDISKFILPRLKRFKELNNGFPVGLTTEQWDEYLDKMILAFEINMRYHKYDVSQEPSKEDWKKFDEGIELFGRYFKDLWW